MNSGELIEKDRKRYEVLRWIYNEFSRTSNYFVNLAGLVDNTFDWQQKRQKENELSEVSDYLANEGLITQQSDDGLLVRLEHRRIVEVENSITNPQSPTEHFSVQVINFNAPVGSVQTGNQSVANVTQNLGAEISDITTLLKELRQHIVDDTPEKQKEGLELLEGLETEVQSPNQSESRIKLYLKELGSFVKDAGRDLIVSLSKELIKDQLGLPK